jgi:beta-glucosidase
VSDGVAGLSYSTFGVKSAGAATKDSVAVTVTNTGKVAGAEVAQLYLTFPAGAGEPPMQLKGFLKTAELAPGATATVTFALSARDRSVWDATAHAWKEVAGSFAYQVGSSSRDAQVSGSFTN